jgi:hypothetical protein
LRQIDRNGCVTRLTNSTTLLLTSLDIGLTGDFEEVEEENEPLSFFDSFPDNNDQSVPKSSQNWAQKRAHPKFASRLFRTEHTLRQTGSSFWSRRGSPPPELAASITEIDPFRQADLETQHIYVLDGFFEIYVYVIIRLCIGFDKLTQS